MSRARRLAAALTVAVIKLLRLAADFILYSATQTTAAESGLDHQGVLSEWSKGTDSF